MVQNGMNMSSASLLLMHPTSSYSWHSSLAEIIPLKYTWHDGLDQQTTEVNEFI